MKRITFVLQNNVCKNINIACRLNEIMFLIFSATATYFISISYTNDNAPIFSPASYTVTVGADTVLGTSVLKVRL